MDANSFISQALLAAQKYYANPHTDTSDEFDGILTCLVSQSSMAEWSARLHLDDNLILTGLLSYFPIFLAASYTSPNLRMNIQLLLCHLAQHNLHLRSVLSGEQYQLGGSIFQSLRISLKEELGPQSLFDALKLLQLISYDKSVVLGSWTNDLVSFLLGELCRATEPEWLPFCIAILCNLASRSKSVCVRIKRSNSYKQFCQKIMTYLAHDSQMVVISALVLVGFLDEQLKDTVFCSLNIAHAYQCIVNILVRGDEFMARHIAIDMMKRLIVAEQKDSISVPTITKMGKTLMTAATFERSLKHVATLLVSIENQEELLKLYDMFIALCEVPDLSRVLSLCLWTAEPVGPRGITPILAVLQMALSSFDQIIIKELPLSAARLLRFVIKEVVENGSRVAENLPPEIVLKLIEANVKTDVETASNLVSFQCRKVTCGLKLAEVCSHDEELRTDLLQVLSAPLCAHIAESQLISNPVVPFVLKMPQNRSNLPEWSINGVEILFELLHLLASLKDYSKYHKDQYWTLLKDDRMIPMIAYGLSSAKSDIVNGALQLYNHCTQVHAFSSRWVGQLVSASFQDRKELCSRSSSLQRRSDIGVGLLNDQNINGSEFILNGESIKQIDQLIAKMKQGLSIEKDSNISQLAELFHRKIATLETRERELEEMVKVKDRALLQSERLRSQYKSQEHDNDMSKFRSLLQDYEAKLEASSKEAKKVGLDLEKSLETIRSLETALSDKQKTMEELRTEMNAKLTGLHRDNSNLSKMLENQKTENLEEREMSEVLRKRYSEMKAKFDQAINSVFEKDEENRLLSEENRRLSDENQQSEGVVARLETVLGDKERECSQFELKEQKARTEGKRLEDEKRQLSKQVADFQAECERLKAENNKYGKLKEQMKRMASEF